MFSRSAVLRSSVRAARLNPTSISQRTVGIRRYATEPVTPPAEGKTTKNEYNTAIIIASVAGVAIAGTYAFLLANPREAQKLGGKIDPQAMAKEEKFNSPRGQLKAPAASPASAAK